MMINLLITQSVSDGVDLLNNNDATTKGVLLFFVVLLLIAIRYLYNENKKMREAITTMQDTFRTEIVSISEKSISSLSAFEMMILENKSNVSKEILQQMRDGHRTIIESVNAVKERVSNGK